MIIRNPQPGDIETIGRTAAEAWVRDRTQSGLNLEPILSNPWTRVVEFAGVPIAAGGFLDKGHDTAIGWALVSSEVPTEAFVTLTRAYRRQMMTSPFKWIEAHCIDTFEQSFRWVRCIGFRPVNGERCFTPDGREFRRFVFVKAEHGH